MAKSTSAFMRPVTPSPELAAIVEADPQALGVSIDARGTAEQRMIEGRAAREVQKITRVVSTDFVSEAGAGGSINELVEAFVEAAEREGEDEMPAPTALDGERIEESPSGDWEEVTPDADPGGEAPEGQAEGETEADPQEGDFDEDYDAELEESELEEIDALFEEEFGEPLEEKGNGPKMGFGKCRECGGALMESGHCRSCGKKHHRRHREADYEDGPDLAGLEDFTEEELEDVAIAAQEALHLKRDAHDPRLQGPGQGAGSEAAPGDLHGREDMLDHGGELHGHDSFPLLHDNHDPRGLHSHRRMSGGRGRKGHGHAGGLQMTQGPDRIGRGGRHAMAGHQMKEGELEEYIEECAEERAAELLEEAVIAALDVREQQFAAREAEILEESEKALVQVRQGYRVASMIESARLPGGKPLPVGAQRSLKEEFFERLFEAEFDGDGNEVKTADQVLEEAVHAALVTKRNELTEFREAAVTTAGETVVPAGQPGGGESKTTVRSIKPSRHSMVEKELGL